MVGYRSQAADHLIRRRPAGRDPLQSFTFSGTAVDLIKDNCYEDLAMEFQYRVVAALDKVLAKKGIPIEDRSDICGELSFDMAMLLDDTSISLDGNEYQSALCFESGDKLYVNAGVLLHEYAFGQ